MLPKKKKKMCCIKLASCESTKNKNLFYVYFIQFFYIFSMRGNIVKMNPSLLIGYVNILDGLLPFRKLLLT